MKVYRVGGRFSKEGGSSPRIFAQSSAFFIIVMEMTEDFLGNCCMQMTWYHRLLATNIKNKVLRSASRLLEDSPSTFQCHKSISSK